MLRKRIGAPKRNNYAVTEQSNASSPDPHPSRSTALGRLGHALLVALLAIVALRVYDRWDTSIQNEDQEIYYVYIDDELFPYELSAEDLERGWFKGEGFHPDVPFDIAEDDVSLPSRMDQPRNEAFEIVAENGAVASDEGMCSDMGVGVLQKGGNAVDAAVTTTLCLGLINFFSSGLGGGGFALVRQPSNRTDYANRIMAYDFRETSPLASTPDMYVANPADSAHGAMSVGVPGELKGLWEMYNDHGSRSLTWEDLVMPVSNLAKDGWAMSRELARRFRSVGSFMANDSAWSEASLTEGGQPAEGHWITRPRYGETLETIAKYGADAFYGASNESRWIADAIVGRIQSGGGIITHEDLARYSVRKYPALESTYLGKRIFTTGAPSAGQIMIGVLNMLEKYNLSTSGLDAHRMIEATKFGYAVRPYIGDPAFISDKDKAVIEAFQTKINRKRTIDDTMTHTHEYYNLTYDVLDDAGTTHLSIVDRWGGAVSLMATLNMNFGSRVMDPITGIIFNNQQADFGIPGRRGSYGMPPAPQNFPAPGKRPLSTATPLIVEDKESGELYAVLGGAGGARIFPAVLQVFLNILKGMGASAAVEAPRLHDQLFPPKVSVESGYDEEIIDLLRSKGHNITVFDINLGVAEVQLVIRLADGTLVAASDSRKHGRAAGY